MNNRYYLLLSFLLITCLLSAREVTGLEAQQKVQGAEKLITGTYSDVPEYIQFKQSAQVPFAKFNAWAHSAFSLSPQYGFALLGADKDAIGMTHYRYRQTYNGMPMAG